MVKKAYLRGQRLKRHGERSVLARRFCNSLKDAQAIAKDPKLKLKEKPFPSDFGTEALR
jgi:hypothetical protein